MKPKRMTTLKYSFGNKLIVSQKNKIKLKKGELNKVFLKKKSKSLWFLLNFDIESKQLKNMHKTKTQKFKIYKDFVKKNKL